jgi:hypothetical protein
MTRKIIFSLLVLLLLAFTVNSVSAGAWKGADSLHDELYNKTRFNNADTDKNGVLDKSELRIEQKEFEFFQDGERFKRADANNDGVLTLDECKVQKQWEKQYHEELWNKFSEDIKQKFPNANLKDANWLSNHPEVVEKAIENRVWLNNHPEVFKKLMSNSKWLAKHPVVAKKGYENRFIAVRHPEISKKLYETRKYWNNHPKLTKKLYKNLKK